MLLGYDVVYLERQWKGRLGNSAVLATLARSLSNRLSQFPIHCGAERGSGLSRRRAFACMMPSKNPICK
jgi:hypothetical protein